MTLLQFGIGATNDVVDAPRDAGLKAGKPIPAGVVSRRAAAAVATIAAGGGLALAAAAGVQVLGLSVLVLGVGLAYDLRLKGTAWSWLPFAVGIPILPVYGWLGATGSVPELFTVLVPVAVAAGAALAIANSLVDVERDTAAGVGSIAARLGLDRAWEVGAALVAGIILAALISALAWRGVAAVAIVAVAALPAAAATLLARRADPGRRERAWQLEAAGLGVLAVTWVAVVGR